MYGYVGTSKKRKEKGKKTKEGKRKRKRRRINRMISYAELNDSLSYLFCNLQLLFAKDISLRLIIFIVFAVPRSAVASGFVSSCSLVCFFFLFDIVIECPLCFYIL